MALHLSSDTAMAGWLATLGVTTLCQWDVLVFFASHETTLLGAADLARLLGYTSHSLLAALDVLQCRDLVVRSRVSQGARLYQFRVPRDAPRAEAFARLWTLATARAGRIRLLQHVRRYNTQAEHVHQAPHCAVDAQQGRQVPRHQHDARAERRTPWRPAT